MLILIHLSMLLEFSSPMPWDPEDEHDDEETLAWFDSVEDEDQLDLVDFYDSCAGWIVGDGPNTDAEATTTNMQVHANANQTSHKTPDYQMLRPFFGWKPLEVVCNTLKATTCFGKSTVCLPLRCHFKSRFPALNVCCLDKTVATDTFFANACAYDGYTCAQLFIGKTSQFTQVYGMKSDSEFPGTLMDFICSFGTM